MQDCNVAGKNYSGHLFSVNLFTIHPAIESSHSSAGVACPAAVTHYHVAGSRVACGWGVCTV